MNKILKSVKFFPMLVLGCALCLTACSDDDDESQGQDTVTTDVMLGSYTGKMIAYGSGSSVEAYGDDADGSAEGVDITAYVDKDTVCIESFPIKDIVLSIVGDETLADEIVASAGEVKYNIGYVPTLSTAKDSISMELAPEPLRLALTMPSGEDGKDSTLVVEVKVECGQDGKYSVDSGNMKFDISATEVLLGEGDSQEPLSGFEPMDMRFDMNQNSLVHYGY